MRQYVSGGPEDIQNFETQVRRMNSRHGLVFMGSFARAAMYSTLKYDVEPLSLRKGAVLRDIDILMTRRYWEEPDRGGGPHPVEAELSMFFDRHARVPTLVHGMVELDPRLFRTRTRSLDGLAVRTLSIGTHLELERYFARMMPEQSPYDEPIAKYDIALETFTAFAEHAREYRKHEFYPDELYQPLREASSH